MKFRSSLIPALRSSLGQQAGVYLVATLVTAALPFLLLPVLTRALTPAEYGRAAMFAVLVMTGAQLVGLGSHAALGVRRFELAERDFAAYIRACLLILVRTTGVLAMATVVLQVPLELATGLPREWLLVAVLAAACQGVLQVAFAVWVAEGRPTRYGAVQIGHSALSLVLSILLVVTVGLGWQGRALGMTLAVAVAALIALTMLAASHDLTRHARVKPHIKDALRFGLPLVPHSLGGLLMVVTDRFIVSAVLGAAAVGVYMVGSQIGMALTLVTESFNRAYAPWLMKRLKSDVVQDDAALVRTTYWYFAFLLVSALALGFLAAPLVGVLAGGEFEAAADLVKYIALGCAFTGCYYMVTNYVFFVGATRPLAVITLAVGVANIPLTWVLVNAWGLSGAAMSFALAQLAAFLATWRLAQRHHPMPWFSFWSRRQTPRAR